jgi:hypothetical protein
MIRLVLIGAARSVRTAAIARSCLRIVGIVRGYLGQTRIQIRTKGSELGQHPPSEAAPTGLFPIGVVQTHQYATEQNAHVLYRVIVENYFATMCG